MAIWWPWVRRGLHGSCGMAIWWPWVSRGLHGGGVEAMGELSLQEKRQSMTFFKRQEKYKMTLL